MNSLVFSLTLGRSISLTADGNFAAVIAIPHLFGFLHNCN